MQDLLPFLGDSPEGLMSISQPRGELTQKVPGFSTRAKSAKLHEVDLEKWKRSMQPLLKDPWGAGISIHDYGLCKQYFPR